MRNRSTLIRTVIYILTLCDFVPNLYYSLLVFLWWLQKSVLVRLKVIITNFWRNVSLSSLFILLLYFLFLTTFTRIAYLRTFGRSNPGRSEIFHTSSDRVLSPPSLLCNGNCIILWGKAAGAWLYLRYQSSAEIKERVDVFLCPLLCLPVRLQGEI